MAYRILWSRLTERFRCNALQFYLETSLKWQSLCHFQGVLNLSNTPAVQIIFLLRRPSQHTHRFNHALLSILLEKSCILSKVEEVQVALSTYFLEIVLALVDTFGPKTSQ
jgi:hypothetical protein